MVAAAALSPTGCQGLAYVAGLRVAEVAALRVGDIDSQRMLIRGECGEGGRSRQAMVSPDLLGL
jgi:integrase/recombinase XerD